MDTNVPSRLGDDLLNGAKEIAEYLGWSQWKVYYAHRKRALPIGNLGNGNNSLFARKSELSAALSVGLRTTE